MAADFASAPAGMLAVVLGASPGELRVERRPVPSPAPSEVLVRVMAAGVNRADILQRAGRYPAPAGAPPDIPGLELAGTVVARGRDATLLAPGDRVFGIVGGGAQAGYVTVHERQLLRIPERLGWEAAAAVPEAFITAHDALVSQAALAAGETVLVHAVGSGVGLAAVQVVRALGGRAFGTSRTAAKLEVARSCGMEEGLLTSDGLDGLKELAERCTGGRGFDVVLDLLGGAYVGASAEVAAHGGRMMLVGTIARGRATLPLGTVLSRRLTLRGTVLRSRSDAEKAEATRSFGEELLPLFASGEIEPVVDRVFGLGDVEAAYEHVATDRAVGKAVLRLFEGDLPSSL